MLAVRTSRRSRISTAIAVLGAWLALSPLALGYESSDPSWNAVICGGVAAALALTRTRAADRASALSWITAVIGAWLILSTALFESSARADWNQVLTGVAILSLAIWSIRSIRMSPR